MLKLRDIMTKDVITLTPATTLRDAAELLVRRHVSGAPVIDGGRIVGVVSASDLLGFAASEPGVPTERPLQTEWGDWDDVSTTADAENEDEAPATYFTDLWADVGEDVSARMSEVEAPEWSALDEHTVEEVMTRRLWVLGPDEDVGSAASLMSQAAVHRVLVMDGEKLLGVVSTTDLARVVAEHQVGTRTFVFNHDREFDERGWE